MNENEIIHEITEFIFPSKYLPEIFSNDDVLANLDTIYTNLGTTDQIINKTFEYTNRKIGRFQTAQNAVYSAPKGVEPISFTISKANRGARSISIANPIVLLLLHKYILDNHEVILFEQEDENEYYVSNSRFEYNEDTIGFHDVYGNGDEEEIILYEETEKSINQPDFITSAKNYLTKSNGSYYRLEMDISNFFNSIYSHMISWDLKDISNKVIFENLDILNRTLNQNETKGILIGPYTSNLFSEIILSKTDKKIKEICQKYEVYYVRYCDDYFFYSDSKEILEIIIDEVTASLLEYKFDINPSKTKIEEFPFYVSRIKVKDDCRELENAINKHSLQEDEKIKDEDELELVETIIEYLEKNISSERSFCNYMLKCLISKLDYKFKFKINAEILLDYLMNSMLKYDYFSKNISNLILKIFNSNELENEKIVTKWISKKQKLLKRQKNISNIFMASIILKLNITNDIFDNYLIENFNSNDLIPILIIEYMLKHNKIKKFKKVVQEYLKSMDNDLKARYNGAHQIHAYHSKYWLILYTNFTKWNLHTRLGFKPILKKYNLDDLATDENILCVFKCLKDLGISFINI